jgi:EmrB/QacA subfamily drug resistance transporter
LQRKWWTLIATCVALLMLLLDITVVNVALDDIQSDLDASFSDLQWVIDAYALTLAALLLTAGSLADLLGRRRVFGVGVGLFTLASLACALAPSALALILSRGAQGIGGAIMFSTAFALVAQDFQGRDRGVAFGAIGATTGAAVAVGPLVGGALTEGLGWEWIFLVNLPVGAAAIAVTLLRLRETRDPEGRGVDWAGVATFSAALFLLVFALIRGNPEGWGSPLIVGFLAGSGALLVAFLAIERAQERPMLDLTLFRKPTFGGAAIVAFALSASMFSLFLYIALYMQNVLGYSPLETGIRFLPVTVVSFFAAVASGRLSARLPARGLLSGGLALVGTGILLMRGVEPGSDWTELIAGFAVAGAGIGVVNPPLASTAIGVVPPARSGMASGINSTFRQVGIATGIAGLGALFQDRIEAAVAAGLRGTPGAANADVLAQAAAAGGADQAIAQAPPEARAEIAQVLSDAFVTSLDDLFLVGAIVAFSGALIAFALVRQRDFVVAPDAAPAPA